MCIRDRTHPILPFTYSFWAFKPVYTKAFRPVTVTGQVQPGTAGRSPVKPGTARYRQLQYWKDPSCAIFFKSRRFEDIKYDTKRYVWGINWGTEASQILKVLLEWCVWFNFGNRGQPVWWNGVRGLIEKRNRRPASLTSADIQLVCQTWEPAGSSSWNSAFWVFFAHSLGFASSYVVRVITQYHMG